MVNISSEKSVQSYTARCSRYKNKYTNLICGKTAVGRNYNLPRDSEIEIVYLMKNGLTNKEIAEDLFIAESTVKKHISHIFEKLQVGSREELKYKLRNRRSFLD